MDFIVPLAEIAPRLINLVIRARLLSSIILSYKVCSTPKISGFSPGGDHILIAFNGENYMIVN